jgi:hypothetical protein
MCVVSLSKEAHFAGRKPEKHPILRGAGRRVSDIVDRNMGLNSRSHRPIGIPFYLTQNFVRTKAASGGIGSMQARKRDPTLVGYLQHECIV